MREPVDRVNHPSGPDAAHDGVLELVHRLMHQARSLQALALRGGPHEVTHMESKVMAFFARHPGATQSDLAQHSGRDKAQLARLIKNLRERGLLAAEVDVADRRNVHLRLSDAGMQLQRSLRGAARELERRAVSGLAKAEREQLLALLQRVQRNLDGAN